MVRMPGAPDLLSLHRKLKKSQGEAVQKCLDARHPKLSGVCDKYRMQDFCLDGHE